MVEDVDGQDASSPSEAVDDFVDDSSAVLSREKRGSKGTREAKQRGYSGISMPQKGSVEDICGRSKER